MLYGVLCNDQGGIFDELLCFRFTANRFWLTPSPARVAEVAAYIEGRAADLNVSVTNLGYANAYLSVQGPRSRELLATLTGADLSNAGLPFGRLTEDRLGGVPKAVIARSGYSGELGYELFFPVEYAEHVWDAVATAGEPFGIRPCGMKTMRSLRIEKMYFLYGIDISGRTDPLSAGLGSIVQFDDRAFVGRAALEHIAEMGPQQRLCLLDCGAIHPIATGDAVNADGQQVATVTSADPGYTLGSTFAFAHLPVKLAVEGAEVLVTSKVVAEPIKARVLLRAPYDPDRRRLTS